MARLLPLAILLFLAFGLEAQPAGAVNNGRPTGGYENFVTGFWVAGEERAQVWGRPIGLAVATDGSLLIADDVSQSVWRVSYRR